MLMCVFLWSLTFNRFSKCFISIHINKTYFKSWLCLFGQCVSHSVVSDSLRPHGLWPARLLCPWDSSGKNTGVDCHSLLQRIFPTQGIKPGSPALQADSLSSEPQGYCYCPRTHGPAQTNYSSGRE